MQAVILAGGKGTRLRPLTYQISKPMIPIVDKPFLQYVLEMIRFYGIVEVVLLAGYLGGQIEKYFGNGARSGLYIRYAYERSPLGTGGALKNAKRILAKEFLLLNGDTFLPIDYRQVIKFFYKNNKHNVVVVYSNPDHIAPNNIALGESNFVIGYNKKDARGMTYIDAGAMVLNKDILDLIPAKGVCSLEKEIFPKLIKKKKLLGYPTSQRFYDMGTPQRLKVIEEVLR